MNHELYIIIVLYCFQVGALSFAAFFLFRSQKTIAEANAALDEAYSKLFLRPESVTLSKISVAIPTVAIPTVAIPTVAIPTVAIPTVAIPTVDFLLKRNEEN